jgi:Bacterial transcriptional activator domain
VPRAAARGVLYEPFARAEIERLTEARLAALEDCIDSELQAGGGSELVAELERSVADHPLRERLIAGLMLALYRAGRHSDALAAYRAARTRLVEELGLEPGPELRDLEQRILNHDPSLGTARPHALARRPLRDPASRRVVLFGALVLAAVTVTALVFGWRSHRHNQPRLLGGTGLVAIDAGSGARDLAAPLSDAIGAVGRQWGSGADRGLGGGGGLPYRSANRSDR